MVPFFAFCRERLRDEMPHIAAFVVVACQNNATAASSTTRSSGVGAHAEDAFQDASSGDMEAQMVLLSDRITVVTLVEIEEWGIGADASWFVQGKMRKKECEG
jgi:hypothetical protein